MFLKIKTELINLDRVENISVAPNAVSFWFGNEERITFRLDGYPPILSPEEFETLKLYLETKLEGTG